MYTPIWSKYRPAILKMMVNASDSPQEYQLSAHEFRAMNAKQKGGYAFVLQVTKGKAVNTIRDSVIAQELLEILQLSKRASELTNESVYEFVMDKQFVLRVTKIG
jgi:hypothetical protein